MPSYAAALPFSSPVKSFHDSACSALICEILTLLTRNLRAVSAVRLPRERYWAIRRWTSFSRKLEKWGRH